MTTEPKPSELVFADLIAAILAGTQETTPYQGDPETLGLWNKPVPQPK